MSLVRVISDAGSGLTCAFFLVAAVVAAVVAVLVAYLGIAMLTAIRAEDPEKANIGYKMFRDLLALFSRGGRP